MAASLVALSAVPYFFFPREMPKEVGEVLRVALLALHTASCIPMHVPPSPPALAAASTGSVVVEVVMELIAASLGQI